MLPLSRPALLPTASSPPLGCGRGDPSPSQRHAPHACIGSEFRTLRAHLASVPESGCSGLGFPWALLPLSLSAKPASSGSHGPQRAPTPPGGHGPAPPATQESSGLQPSRGLAQGMECALSRCRAAASPAAAVSLPQRLFKAGCPWLSADRPQSVRGPILSLLLHAPLLPTLPRRALLFPCAEADLPFVPLF